MSLCAHYVMIRRCVVGNALCEAKGSMIEMRLKRRGQHINAKRMTLGVNMIDLSRLEPIQKYEQRATQLKRTCDGGEESSAFAINKSHYYK